VWIKPLVTASAPTATCSYELLALSANLEQSITITNRNEHSLSDPEHQNHLPMASDPESHGTNSVSISLLWHDKDEARWFGDSVGTGTISLARHMD
jgi:hypothetical protein